MRLTSVRLTPGLLPTCRPLWGDRSFHTSAELEATLHHASGLLASRRARGTVLFDEHGRARYFGMTVFASTPAIEALWTGTPHRIGTALLHACEDGAVLDLAQIGRGNAEGGLELVVCAQGYAMDGASHDEWGMLMGSLLKDFHDVHRGFRLRRMIGEVFGAEGVDIVLRANVYPDVRLTSRLDLRDVDVPSAAFSLTHPQAVERCSALLPMFTYFPPRVQFTPPEQDVLREALDGATDQQIAARLGLGVAAVKSRLTRAYERLQARLPGLLPVRDGEDMARGAQVRHLVLDFVRTNPSELTPYERVRADQAPR